MISRFTRQEKLKSKNIVAVKKTVNKSYKPHWHEFYEIEFIISGSGTYTVDGKDYPIESGMCFFMSPISFHSVETKNVLLYNISFLENIANSTLLNKLSTSGSIVFKAEGSLYDFYTLLIKELVSAEGDFDLSSSYLNAVLARISSIVNENDSPKTDFLRAVKYIHGHFRDKITLKEVAAQVGFAPTYFSIYFKENANVGFKEYVDNLRFNYATNLLKYTDYSVSEIASESGFDDFPNFVRRFKNRFNASPGKFRQIAGGKG